MVSYLKGKKFEWNWHFMLRNDEILTEIDLVYIFRKKSLKIKSDNS